MIATEMEKPTSPQNAPVLTEVLEEKHIETLKVGYDAAKDGVLTCLFILAGEAMVDTIQRGKMESLLIKNNKALTQSDRFNDPNWDEWLDFRC